MIFDPPRFSGRVLLVEDNAINQLVASEMLQALGLDVVVAGDGAEALEELATQRFDLVLMDCMMPRLDGYETARRWRAEEERVPGRRIPIAALTANSTPTDRSRCFECGMDDHLTKPLVWSPLIDLLRRFLPAERGSTVSG